MQPPIMFIYKCQDENLGKAIIDLHFELRKRRKYGKIAHNTLFTIT